MNATVTYSVEDNKLRLYVGRVPRADYDALRAACFGVAPKQGCDFVATWTPQREDLAREFLDDGEDIGDEDYSPQERAADRAERFEGYREKREGEAVGSADAFESGPAAFGHQSRARAERQAARHDRKRAYAVSQWAKAEYWQERTAAVIAHALYKSSAAVRRSRILTLEAEQRKHEKTRAEYAAKYAAWSKVPTLEGADRAGVRAEDGNQFTPESVTPALRLAYSLANGGGGWDYKHPRTGKGSSLYSHLTDSADPITPAEAAALWLAGKRDPGDPESRSARWSRHYELRLAYERAMLAAEGGTAAEADMVPGGWIRASNRTGSVFTDVPGGWMQIHGVNKSPVTGRVVSVKVMGTVGCRHPKPGLVSVNVERLPEGAYRAPTAEELEAFQAASKAAKAEKKASTPKAPPLINPTDADAEKLQAMWNAAEKARHEEGRGYGEPPVSTVWRMTQAEYSARSKGTYGICETSDITEQAKISRGRGSMGVDRAGRATVFKVRTGSASSDGMYGCRRVVIITDKPRKAIPWVAVGTARMMQPTEKSMLPKLGELAEALHTHNHFHITPEQKKLIADAVYVGWAWEDSTTQRGFTPKGLEVYKANGEPKAAKVEAEAVAV